MIDPVDRQLIRLLKADGRMPYLELARRTHLSANATAVRVRKLVGSGIIKGFTAIIDESLLGRPLVVYADFRVKPGADSVRFEQAVRSIDGVIEVTMVTGRYDYQVKLACADQADLTKKLVKLRSQPGVQESYTRLILGEAGT